MVLSIIALIIALVGAGGALYAIFKGVDIATRKPVKTATLPPGKYILHKVEGTEDTFDLEPVDEEEKES